MRHNGCGSEGITCSCGGELPEFRCSDCHGIQMFCHECTLQKHVHHPLHRIEVCLLLLWHQCVTDHCQMWNGTFFQHITLKKLGVRIQLGHNPGERCYNPRPTAGDDFMVIGLNGVHEVALDFCGWTSVAVLQPRSGTHNCYVCDGIPQLSSSLELQQPSQSCNIFIFYHLRAKYPLTSSTIRLQDALIIPG